MTLYMAQFTYTREAWGQLTKNPEDRTAAIKQLCEKLGCRFEGLFYSFGEYDGLVLLDAPDEATAASVALAVLAPGHVKTTKITTLIRPATMIEAMKKAGGAGYRGPTS
jgi:uncharacterized protein with GYD domain